MHQKWFRIVVGFVVAVELEVEIVGGVGVECVVDVLTLKPTLVSYDCPQHEHSTFFGASVSHACLVFFEPLVFWFLPQYLLQSVVHHKSMHPTGHCLL